ncbi:MAG: response regulator [Candidatus Omnitrophota bacterium]|jgi:DNA-binding response OmpR family regulator
MVKLLIVDDEKEICEEFRETLEQEGFEVDVATSGKDGLQKIRQNLYNLVLLDESMPGMEGDKVFEYLREFSKVPVAFVSGFLTPSKERKVMSMGAVKCLRKPLELGQVKSLIHTVIFSKRN